MSERYTERYDKNHCHYYKRELTSVEDAKVEAFLADIFAVYEKHDMAICHEDGHGAFELVSNDEFYRKWLAAAKVRDLFECELTEENREKR